MKKIMLGIFGLLLAQMGYSYEPGKTYHLTILHTNDTHGQFWKNGKGEHGFSAQKTLVDQIRKEVVEQGGQTLLLSGGDINTGNPRSDMLDAEPDFMGMNLLGYDAMVLGNHEFDKPENVLLKQKEMAKFPFLAANIYKKGTNERPFIPYVIKDMDGLKVALFGLVTEDTKFVANPEATANYDFHPSLEEARDLIPRLKKESDFQVALTHIGHYPAALGGASSGQGDEALADSAPGIDVIVGGHTQIKLEKPVEKNGALILQAEDWGKYVGRLDLSILDGKITDYQYRLIPVNKKYKMKTSTGEDLLDENKNPVYGFVEPEIPEDPQMLKLLQPYYDKGGESLKQVVGQMDGQFIGRGAKLKKETNLGRLAAHSMAVASQADVGMVNDGGLRTHLGPGPVSYEDILTTMPFGNSICTFGLSGSELKNYIESIQDVVHFSGVQLVKVKGKIQSLKVNGKDVDLNDSSKKFKIAVNSFNASGGDKWQDQSKRPDYVNTGIKDAQAFKEYLEKEKFIRVDSWAHPNTQEQD